MGRKKKGKWVKMGSVGVDSGQLMVCDPCYLDSWDKEDEFIDSRKYKNIRNDKIFEFRKDFFSYEEQIEEENGKTPNQLIYKDKLWEKIPYKPSFTFGYNYVSHKGDKQYKQIPYHLGHAGLAVVFNSGLGDGVYDVYGKFREIEGWGERITDIHIKLVDDDEAKKILKYFKKVFWTKN